MATLAIVAVLVWLVALFIPAGEYTLDADGAPIPGTYEQVPDPLTFWQSVQQLLLSPINGIYGLFNPETDVVDTETVGRMFGQIGVIVFIMAIGAFISVSFHTKALRGRRRPTGPSPALQRLAAHHRRHGAVLDPGIDDGVLGRDPGLLRPVHPVDGCLATTVSPRAR